MKDEETRIIENTEYLRRTKRQTQLYNPDFTQATTLEGAWYKTESGYVKFKDLPKDEDQKKTFTGLFSMILYIS